MIYTPHKNPGDLCHAVDRVAASQGCVLTARPHNMYDPDHTIWWLVPSTDWPAYQHAKLFLDWQNDDHDALWAGVYVEKGLDPSIAEFAAKKTWVMKPDWAWHAMVKRLRSGQLEEKILQLAGQVPVRVHVMVEGSYAGVPSFDPEKPKFQSDQYLFALDQGSRQLALAELPKTRGHVLGDLSKVKSLGDLGLALEMLGKNAWLWIDFMIMIGLRIGDAPPSPDEAWRDATLWVRFLQPLHDALL